MAGYEDDFDYGKPLGWRTVHPGSKGTHYGPNTHGAIDLVNFFNRQGNISFKWLFFNNTDSEVFNKIVQTIPVALIMRNMENLAQPVYTEFVETNRDPDFMEIGERFYKELFWNETLFVSYDFFSDKDSYTIDTQAIDKEPEEIDYFREVGGFDTWIKITQKEWDKDTRFLHLATGLTVDIPN